MKNPTILYVHDARLDSFDPGDWFRRDVSLYPRVEAIDKNVTQFVLKSDYDALIRTIELLDNKNAIVKLAQVEAQINGLMSALSPLLDEWKKLKA